MVAVTIPRCKSTYSGVHCSRPPSTSEGLARRYVIVYTESQSLCAVSAQSERGETEEIASRCAALKNVESVLSNCALFCCAALLEIRSLLTCVVQYVSTNTC